MTWRLVHFVTWNDDLSRNETPAFEIFLLENKMHSSCTVHVPCEAFPFVHFSGWFSNSCMHPNSSFSQPKHIAVYLFTQNIVTKYQESHVVAIHQACEHYYSAFQQYFHPTYILYCAFSRTSDILNRFLKISWTLVSLDHDQICIWLISAKCVQEYQFPNYAVIKSDFPGRNIKWPGVLENSLSYKRF